MNLLFNIITQIMKYYIITLLFIIMLLGNEFLYKYMYLLE